MKPPTDGGRPSCGETADGSGRSWPWGWRTNGSPGGQAEAPPGQGETHGTTRWEGGPDQRRGPGPGRDRGETVCTRRRESGVGRHPGCRGATGRGRNTRRRRRSDIHLDVTSDADWVEAVGTATNRYG